MRVIKLISISILVSIVLLGCKNSPDRIFWSPYENINWNEIDYNDAEFHTHPGLGDEEYDPHQTIDRYHAEGYKILALAGHDYHIPTEQIGSIYPWTELSSIYETIKDIENTAEDNLTYGEIANEPYQNRDPVALGMVSVEGCEVSAPHHVISLFSSYSSSMNTEDETFSKITELGGIAFFAHPGVYVERNKYTSEWYVDLYKKYDMLLGQSIYNREDNHPNDRAFFDEIAHELGVERPIWLFGEDDMHTENTLGWNRNVILIENFKPGSLHPDIQDGSAPNVRAALENGHFFLWKPSEKYNKRSFNIINIKSSMERIELELDKVDKVEIIRWITYNPGDYGSQKFHEGRILKMENVPVSARFVRAEIKGEGGTIYTQPFYIIDNLLSKK